MADIVDEFRAKLSEELRAALAKRDKEEVSTIRSLMAALDNAGALSKEEIARLPDFAGAEVPRRKMSQSDIERILQSEIELRKNAFDDYSRIGNAEQAELVERSIATIRRLAAMLG